MRIRTHHLHIKKKMVRYYATFLESVVEITIDYFSVNNNVFIYFIKACAKIQFYLSMSLNTIKIIMKKINK